MSDLTEILKMQWEAYPNALKTGQEAQASAIALGNARRAQQERMDLKALYAQQANPSYQAIGAISPEYAQTAMKNQLEMQQAIMGMRHQQAQTGEIENKMDREKEALMSKAALPYLNAYEANKGKIPDAENHHRLMTGLSDIANQAVAGNWAPSHYTTINPNATFESILSNVNKSGVFTDSQRLNQEAAKARGSQEGLVQGGVPMTPQMAHGSVEDDPITGLSYIRPPLKGNQPPVGAKLTGNEGAGYTPEQNAQFNVLQELLDANPNDETLRRSVIAQRQRIELQGGEQPLMPQSEIVTPTQLQTKRVEQKANEEAAITIAKQQAEEQQAINKSLKAYETLPDINHIRDLIKGSIGSDIEYWTNRLGRTVGESLKAGDFQAALAVVASDMASSVAFAPGSQSDKELAQKLKQVGNLDANMTQDEKMSAVEEWFQGRQRYIGKYGKYSDDELIALGREGKITHETALKVRANRNKGQ